MRDLFPGWTPPDEQTLARYWEKATFAVDTSVLLDLYRFSEEARKGLLDALRSFGERLWIPHQVGLEFHRNRFGVLLDQREAEDKLLAELDQIQADIDKQLSQRLRGAGRRDLDPLRKAVEDGFGQLREKLQEAEKAHTKGLGASIRDDPIYEEVIRLCDAKVGPPFDDDRQTQVLADAEERLKNQIPPGYLDANKDGDARFGDVILWHQLCDKGQETGKPVVLIADDQKADWLWEVRGKTLGPRPELVAEMRLKAGVGFHIYTPARLLQIWDDRDGRRNVGREVLDEIEASAVSLGRGWGPETGKWPEVEGWTAQGSPEGEPRGLLSTFANLLAAYRQGVASHRAVDGSVELSLEVNDEMAARASAGIRAIVFSPNGTTASVEFRGSDRTPQVVTVLYPESFSEAVGLLEGTYHVSWWAVGVPDVEPGMQRLLGQDRFVVDRSGNVT